MESPQSILFLFYNNCLNISEWLTLQLESQEVSTFI